MDAVTLLLQQVESAPPFLAGPWTDRAGLSEPPPGYEGGEEWARWFQRVRVDLRALRQCAEAVHRNTVEYVASLRPTWTESST